MYRHRNDSEEAALKHLAGGPYASEDHPYLYTQRYAVNAAFEPQDVLDKMMVDQHGAEDNLHHYYRTAEENTAGRIR